MLIEINFGFDVLYFRYKKSFVGSMSQRFVCTRGRALHN